MVWTGQRETRLQWLRNLSVSGKGEIEEMSGVIRGADGQDRFMGKKFHHRVKARGRLSDHSSKEQDDCGDLGRNLRDIGGQSKELWRRVENE